jgi:integrase
MLILCPECGLQVSDIATSCPHCGYPLTPKPQIPVTQPVQQKRMHLPNGFGSISEIHSKRLRKPFYVTVPAGKTPEGRPVRKPLKPISYFKTYNEAYQALVAYHRDPYDPETNITFQELFDMWCHEKEKTVEKKSLSRFRSLWRYSDSIKDITVRELRVRHLKECLSNGSVVNNGKAVLISPITSAKLKFLYNQLFDYAVENEYLDKNIARLFNVSTEFEVQHEHFPYTEEEISILWNNLDTCDVADVLLIQCYSGWRPLELCKLKIADVHLEERWIQGGIKTKSGKNRQVPIHKKILPLVQKRYEEAIHVGSEYLFNHPYERWPDRWTRYSYDYLSDAFLERLPLLGINSEHRGHDGRVHFITMAKANNMDEYALKRIVGHKIDDITERVYTKRTIEWLISEIDKIP